MRPFEQIFSRPHRVAGQPHFPTHYNGHGCWWDDEGIVPLAAGRGFNINVVGELQWQDEIAAITGGRCEEGHNCHFPAQLVFDDNRPHDHDAVGVMIDHRAVGWIPDEHSAGFRAALRLLNPAGRPITCKAKIIGGWEHGNRDRGYFGVKLSLAIPLKVHSKARCLQSAKFGRGQAPKSRHSLKAEDVG